MAVVTRVITPTGYGLPDYEKQTRTRTVWGYHLDLAASETFLFSIIIATAAPGPYAFTRVPIPAGVTVELIDAFTGLPGINAIAGEDFLIKEIWLNFDQPVLFQEFQAAIPDISCECYAPAYANPSIQGLPIGWTRAQLEPINVASVTNFRVTNLGAAAASGKAWVVGFRKPSQYVWY